MTLPGLSLRIAFTTVRDLGAFWLISVERPVIAESGNLHFDLGCLFLEEWAERVVEAGIAHPVGGMDPRRHQTAAELVDPLGAGLEAPLLGRDRVLDGHVVTELEVQHLVRFVAAPIAAVEMRAL